MRAGSSLASSENKENGIVYAYCHGFLSDETSKKGIWLKNHLKDTYGVDLKTPNLNGGPTAATVTPETGIEALDKVFQESGARKMRLVGSSLGGYIAALYASRYPSKIDRLTLICPSFDMENRWNKLWGPEVLNKWESDGFREFQGFHGRPNVEVPFSFVEACSSTPPYPEVSCPTCILHGLDDQVVPVETSEKFIEKLSQVLEPRMESLSLAGKVMLQVIQDNHDMTSDEALKLLSKTVAWQWNTNAKVGDSTQSGQVNEKMEIEVERKFEISNPNDCEEKIKKAGGELVTVQSFEDRYWDLSDEWILGSESCWMRERAGIWEIKVPLEEIKGGSAEVYQEITGAGKISEFLQRRWPEKFPENFAEDCRKSPENFSEMLQRAGISVYAKYRTRRAKYKLGDIFADVDNTQYSKDSSFCLLELETIATNRDEIGEGRAKLDRVAFNVLNLCQESATTKGKLTEYIIRFVPEMLSKLLKSPKFSHLKSVLNKERFTNSYQWAQNSQISLRGIKLSDFGSDNRGITSTRDIKKGDTIVELPTDSVIRYDEKEECPREYSDTFREVWDKFPEWYVRLGLKLFWEVEKGKDSPLHGYLSLLPSGIPEWAPFQQSEEEIRKSFGFYPSLAEKIIKQKRKFDTISRQIAQLSVQGSELQQKEVADRLKWAFYQCISRAFQGEFGGQLWEAFVPGLPIFKKLFNKDDMSYVLLPFVDSHNHNSNVTTMLDYNPGSNSFSLQASENFSKDSQVYISYGKYTNDALLQRFSFVEEDNMFDTYHIPCEVLKSALAIDRLPNRLEQDGITIERFGEISNEAEIISSLEEIVGSKGSGEAMLRVIGTLMTKLEDAQAHNESKSEEFSAVVEKFRREKLRILRETYEKLSSRISASVA